MFDEWFREFRGIRIVSRDLFEFQGLLEGFRGLQKVFFRGVRNFRGTGTFQEVSLAF